MRALMYIILYIRHCRIHIKETDDIKKIWLLKMEAVNMIIYKAELIYESLQCGNQGILGRIGKGIAIPN